MSILKWMYLSIGILIGLVAGAELVSNMLEFNAAKNRCIVSEYEKESPRSKNDIYFYCNAQAKTELKK